MKKIFYIMAFLSVAASCTDVVPEPDSQDNSAIELSTSSLTFLNTGEPVDAASVVVESSGTWTLIGRTDWCYPSVNEGRSGETVTFTADINPGSDARTAEFSFVCGSRTEKLYVMQKHSNVIELYKDEFSLPQEGGQIAVRVSANAEVSVTIPQEALSWIEQAESPSAKSLDLSVFYFNIKPTDQYTDRNASLVFSSEGVSAEAEVSQDRKIEITVGQAIYNAGPSGGTIEVKVRTNLPYSVDVPETVSSWIDADLDPNAGTDPGDIVVRTEKFTVGPQTEMSRAGRITLTAIDGSLSASFVISQKGSNPKIINIPDENFRTALSELSYVISDGYKAPQCELTDLGQNATELNVSGRNIRSLEGLSNFPGIETLDCSCNYITRMDFSGTKVYTAYGKGSKLSGNPVEEIIGGDYITCIEVNCAQSPGGEPGLGLVAPDGTASKKLRISGDNIQYVYVQYNPYLEKLDISSCPKITGYFYGGFTGCSIYNPPFVVYFPTGADVSSPVSGAEYIAGPPTEW